ncbi:MAG TPA: hypothetical protein VHZ52_04660 [Acidobacteriaceae bacterium]|jgi:hypothetical protein|nr:hypothetical protein [Acidobacteriaceae bacterium]
MRNPWFESQIDVYIAKHSKLFRLFHFSLDCLNVYARPYARTLKALHALANRNTTPELAFLDFMTSVGELQKIDVRLAMDADREAA